jgi:DNA-binding NtrC family response regulator
VLLEILVADDEPSVRAALADAIAAQGHRVTEAGDGAEAVACVLRRVYDAAFVAMQLGKIDGLTVVRRIRRDSPRTTVVAVSRVPHVAEAVTVMRAGAEDYVGKPIHPEALVARTLGGIVERRALDEELRQARARLPPGHLAVELVGRSPAMVQLMERIGIVARSEAPVLIAGESGTGKELVARLLHLGSARKPQPFIAVNCAALPESLLEAELFGHERGAFTGAIKKRDGRFKLADGGTLFLDEVGEIPAAAQAKLLRVLQEGTIEPLGSSTAFPVNVRILAATHQNLKQLIAAGRFREDLYYRLNVLDLAIPPLRERPGDLPLLLEYFLRRFTQNGNELPSVTPRAYAALARYPFPGNVRELAHAVERAVVLSRGREIDVEHLPPDISGWTVDPGDPADLRPLAAAMADFERSYILRALSLTGGRKTRAAELLGISRKNLWEKLRAHHIVGYERDEARGAS